MRRYYSPLISALLLLLPLSVCAQETASIAGQVVDSDGRSLPGANVVLVGTTFGAATNAEGQYEITGIEPGTYQIRASLVGYRKVTESVSVEAGETVTQDFELNADLLKMEDVVVTGQGQSVEKRKLAANVNVINQRDIEKSPAASIDELLQGRIPGGTIRMQSANPGQGGLMNFRGITSLTGSQTPVIYIDGVRVDTESNTSISYGGESTTALADLVVGEIERIEVTKGGAASTLYGSDAANGVIQIFTDKGAKGEPRVTFQTRQGADFPISRFYKDTGFSFRDDVEDQSSPNFGQGNFIANEFLETGYYQEYQLSVSGGNEDITYNVGGRTHHGNGVQPNNDYTLYSLRANMNTTLTDALNVTFSGSYTRNNFSRLSGGKAFENPITAFEVGDAKWLTAKDSFDEAMEVFLRRNITEGVDRFTFSTSASYRPSDLFSSSLTIGMDHRANEQRKIDPSSVDVLTGNTNGRIDRFNRTSNSVTLEYKGTVSYPREGTFTSDFTFGVQGFRDEVSAIDTWGEGFELPGNRDVSQAADVNVADDFTQQVFNGGFFFKEQVGFKDRLFVNAGLRFDGNSAFGDEVGLEAYPSAGVAYTISDEPFWSGTLDTVVPELKVRAAFGATGKFPSPYEKDRTFQAFPFRGESAVFVSNPGNPNLGPERTSTYEAGIETALFNNRATVNVTYYKAFTSGALIPVPSQPATGEPPQLRNVGKLENDGIELAVDGYVIQTPNVEWSLGASWSKNTNEVTDIGSLEPFAAKDLRGIAQKWVEPGKPIGAWRATTPYDSNGDGKNDSSELRFTGSTPYPTNTGSVTTALYLFNSFRLSAMADWATGAEVFDWNSRWAEFNGLVRSPLPTRYDLNGNPDGWNPSASEQEDLYRTTEAGSALLKDGDYLKIREITASYTLPTSVLNQLRLQNATLSVSARNLWSFTRQELVDPELAGLAGETDGLTLGGEQSGTLSPPRQFRVGLEFTF